MTPCIEVKGLTVAYDERPVLENIDWTVECGTLAAIIGPNGGGKSTLLRALVGRLKPVRGTVRIFGDNPIKVRRHISYLPQNEEIDWNFPLRAIDVVRQGMLPHTPWWLPFGGRLSRRYDRLSGRHGRLGNTVGASVRSHSGTAVRRRHETRGASPGSVQLEVRPETANGRGTARRARQNGLDVAMHALERVKMKDHALRPIGDLSGGQRQRVLLARALSQNAKLILLDEPATALDATAQHDLLDILQELKDEGRTIVATTHDLNCLTDCFDQVLGIRGRVICSGTPDETMLPETLAAVFGRHVPMLTAEGRVTIVEHRD